MDILSAVAKRRKLCGGGGAAVGFSNCATKGLCACIFKKSLSSSFDHLTDDLLAEILLRLPAKFVFRCKSVSKRWLSLTSSLSFTCSFILTRFSNDINKMLLFKVATRLPCIGQAYALPLLHDFSLPFAFDFIPPLRPDNYDINLYYQLNPRKVTDRLLTDIHLIDSYGGLVLLRAVFKDPPLVPSYHGTLPYYHYYVCNPITKHWVELPLISTLDLVGFTCYHLQKAQGEGQDSRVWADIDSYENLIKHNASYDPNKIDFTVVSIKPDEQALVHIIHVLSSADETV
ncbi:F-box protein At2g16450-like [Silene latifolia]|uniref:F-box protein At2g16450-like n=1 Tax=Silene latifolia TaxID=37657 RepID=UPI003D77C1B6